MLKGDTNTRDVIADLVRNAVDETVISQLERRAQEPAVTSKIASRLEDRISNIQAFGRTITVIAQDFTDRGHGAQETRAGADLFVAVKVEDDDGSISKGLLVQAKWSHRADTSTEHKKLLEQCEEMLERTSNAGAFVWLYGATGVDVVPAHELVARPTQRPRSFKHRSVAQQFRDVLDCFQGDPSIAPEMVFENSGGLGAYMEDIAANTGVAIRVGKRFSPRGMELWN